MVGSCFFRPDDCPIIMCEGSGCDREADHMHGAWDCCGGAECCPEPLLQSDVDEPALDMTLLACGCTAIDAEGTVWGPCERHQTIVDKEAG